MCDKIFREMLLAPSFDVEAARLFVREHPKCWRKEHKTPSTALFEDVMRLPYNEDRMKPLIEATSSYEIKWAFQYAAKRNKRKWTQFFIEHAQCRTHVTFDLIYEVIRAEAKRVVRYFLQTRIDLFEPEHLRQAMNTKVFPVVYGELRHLLFTEQRFADFPSVVFKHDHDCCPLKSSSDCTFLAAVVRRKKLVIAKSDLGQYCRFAFHILVTKKNAAKVLDVVSRCKAFDRSQSFRLMEKMRHCLQFKSAQRHFRTDGETFLHRATRNLDPKVARRLYKKCSKVCPKVFFVPNAEKCIPHVACKTRQDRGLPDCLCSYIAEHPRRFFAARGTFKPATFCTPAFQKLRRAAVTIDDHAMLFDGATPFQRHVLMMERPSLVWRYSNADAVTNTGRASWHYAKTIAYISQRPDVLCFQWIDNLPSVSPSPPPTMLATVYFAIDFKTA